jgi:predicted MarR family transcription regulator
MATKEEIKQQKDLNDEVLKSQEAYAKLRENIQDTLFFTRDYADEAKKAAKEVFGSTIAASETSKAFKDVADSAKKITDNYAGVISGQKQYSDLQKESEALEAAKNSLATEYGQVLTTMNVSMEEQQQILNGTANAYDILDSKAGNLTEEQFKLVELFEEQNQQLKDEAANMAEIAKRAKTIDDAMRPLGESAISLQDMGDGLSKGLSQAGLGDISGKLGIEDAINGARETASGLTKGGTEALNMGGKLKVAGNMATTMGKNLMKSLGPAALIAMAIEQIVEAFKLIDGASGEVAKNMGISAEEGRNLVSSSADAAAMSGDLLVSTKDVVAAQMELNQAMGTAVEFSGEFAAEFASIKERTGLSNEAMARFSQNALVAGTSIKDQLSTVSATVMELNAQSGVMLNAKDIQEGIGKMSKAQLLTAGRNTKEMANQVVQAKLLGASMEQLNSIGNSLLDFENSIGAEMEAELLTGKQLNLEKARMAALTGDTATLAKEVKEQMGSAEEFGKLNVIQQEALAKSMGMQREDLAAMLVEQENLEAVKAAGFESTSDAQAAFNQLVADGMTAEQAAAEMKSKGLDDAFTKQMQSETQQEKMNAAMEKLTDLFVQIMDPLMPVIDAIMDLLDPIFAILSPIAKLLGDIIELGTIDLTPLVEQMNKMNATLSAILSKEGTVTLDGTKVGTALTVGSYKLQ